MKVHETDKPCDCDDCLVRAYDPNAPCVTCRRLYIRKYMVQHSAEKGYIMKCNTCYNDYLNANDPYVKLGYHSPINKPLIPDEESYQQF
jgi:hypothetical protein